MREATIATRLKEETRAEHRATEDLLLGKGLRSRDVSLTQYEHLIATSYLVWNHLVECFQEQDNSVPNLPIFLGLRDALLQDVNLLKLEPRTTTIEFSPNSVAAALGAQYVLLGSTLGGRMIAKLLPACPELSHLPSFHFYRACGQVPPATWPKFQRLLAERITTTAEQEACLAAARATFNLYAELYPTGNS
ncbi:biliverdin-producing heme oxygenase [Lewinella sp. 4G2]|uniref:biliverdin-producing heme oxygenase n=1 Tax=Lewinella sp. 4G2 TaxID=1803372 RepID=UPI0007B47351|nr:biliverdin-producing heme oxygenase [Lewinella sp. 4G2]OAV45986.1 hypothetical protein A3850_019010 [Lewinella sp. 4G2]